MADTRVLVGIPCEMLLDALRSAVLHLNGEKAAIAVGELVVVLKLLENADVPLDQLYECIAVCRFVREGVRAMAHEFEGLAPSVAQTLAELEKKLAESLR